ncbi:hypothetical protein LY78DRAFT_594593 [Colletotrichum sublineola]|nr:hypothetical protein LY78DRAFT_594593 [Colletotrichum sublineola]
MICELWVVHADLRARALAEVPIFGATRDSQYLHLPLYFLVHSRLVNLRHLEQYRNSSPIQSRSLTYSGQEMHMQCLHPRRRHTGCSGGYNRQQRFIQTNQPNFGPKVGWLI